MASSTVQLWEGCDAKERLGSMYAVLRTAGSEHSVNIGCCYYHSYYPARKQSESVGIKKEI